MVAEMELGDYCEDPESVNTHCDRMECASSIPALREYGLMPNGLMLAEDPGNCMFVGTQNRVVIPKSVA